MAEPAGARLELLQQARVGGVGRVAGAQGRVRFPGETETVLVQGKGGQSQVFAEGQQGAGKGGGQVQADRGVADVGNDTHPGRVLLGQDPAGRGFGRLAGGAEPVAPLEQTADPSGEAARIRLAGQSGQVGEFQVGVGVDERRGEGAARVVLNRDAGKALAEAAGLVHGDNAASGHGHPAARDRRPAHRHHPGGGVHAQLRGPHHTRV